MRRDEPEPQGTSDTPSSATAQSPGDQGSALRVHNLSKTFPGQVALDGIDLDIRRNEIHALVGQNGSGKSTFIKVVSGFHKPDPGSSACLDDRPVTLGDLSAQESQRIHVVHQDLALVPTLTAVENLGLEFASPGRAFLPLERRRERERAKEALLPFEVDIDLDAPVDRLRPFERAAIAIARALGAMDEETVLLILDEPTASLGREETDRLFAALRRIRTSGVGILYVTHVLAEVYELADRVTVLRDGHRVHTYDVAETSEARLVRSMLGKDLERISQSLAASKNAEQGQTPTHTLLDVQDVTAGDSLDVSFSVHQGEILGFAGLVGSGYRSVMHALFGLIPRQSGHVTLNGEPYSPRQPRDAIAAGVAYVPPERNTRGLVPEFDARENITLPDAAGFWSKGFFDMPAETAAVTAWMKRIDVVPLDPEKRLQDFSGGNQQKVLLAKWLRLHPSILLLDEPTQAVDVGAKATIEQVIKQMSDEGYSIIIASTDAAELVSLCGRVLVFRNGRVTTELSGYALTEHAVISQTQLGPASMTASQEAAVL